MSSGAIQETNEALVDDNLVTCGKIGGSKYYWAFPAKADRDQLNKLEELKQKVVLGKRRLESSKKELEEVRVGREENENGDRASKLRRIEELGKQKVELEVVSGRRMELGVGSEQRVKRAAGRVSGVRSVRIVISLDGMRRCKDAEMPSAPLSSPSPPPPPHPPAKIANRSSPR